MHAYLQLPSQLLLIAVLHVRITAWHHSRLFGAHVQWRPWRGYSSLATIHVNFAQCTGIYGGLGYCTLTVLAI